MTEQMQLALKVLDIFKARHPRPSHVTIKQAAEMLNLSPPTVSKMVHCGTFKLNRCGRIPIEQVDAALTTY
ncbi:DNA-binding protein [Paraburkholderia sp. Ac-20340]|nr:DNA-binding protein [Paraburkholderia sp. Ac-20340]